MQKNYLLFIIDSLNYSHVKESNIELMPFFNSLKKESIFCESMYSQAPYTEAAVMNLYCGQDVLQNGGYLNRFKDVPMTLFEAMKQKGYVTYYNSYQPQCHPSSIRRGIDYIYYNVGYDLGALWSYRLSHYAEQLKKGNLTEADYRDLHEIFNDNFAEWIRFLDDLLSGNDSANMIYDNASNYDAREVKKRVEQEYSQYIQQPDAYINDVLQKGNSHSLFSIPAFVQDRKIKDRNIIREAQKEFLPLMKRIKRMNFRLNLKNCKGVMRGPIKKIGEFLKHPGKDTFKNLLKSSYLVANQLFDLDLYKRIDDDYECFKNAPSAKTHIDHYVQWAVEHKEQGAHFACVHLDDIHNPEVFFTYDSSDINLLKRECEDAKQLLSEIPKDYYGSITHDLSLRYIDNMIKYLYERMEKCGLLDNTCIAICADHGFSFSGNPLRDSFVINLFLENYHIPCLFTGTGLPSKCISSLRTSKDIAATLCSLADDKIPESFTGHSIEEDYEYTDVHIEYCGGGCPDLSRREIKLAAFNKEYFVGTLSKLDDVLDEKSITEIYDLSADPRQLNNLIHSRYDEEKVTGLLEQIEQRRKEISGSIPGK